MLEANAETKSTKTGTQDQQKLEHKISKDCDIRSISKGWNTFKYHLIVQHLPNDIR